MFRFARIAFTLNALHQALLGGVCLLAPALAIGLYGGTTVEQESPILMIAFWVLGMNLLLLAALSTWVARRPATKPLLRTLLGVIAVLGLARGGVIFARSGLSFAQTTAAVVDALVQVLVIVAALFYRPSPKVPQAKVPRRAIAA
jgi:hypothetical protein